VVVAASATGCGWLGGGVVAATEGCVLATITGSGCAGTPAEGLPLFDASGLADDAVSFEGAGLEGTGVVAATGCTGGCDVAGWFEGAISLIVTSTDALVAVGAATGFCGWGLGCAAATAGAGCSSGFAPPKARLRPVFASTSSID